MVPRSFRPMDFAGSSDAHVKASGRESPPMLMRFLKPLSMVSTEPANVPFSNLADVSSTIMVLFPRVYLPGFPKPAAMEIKAISDFGPADIGYDIGPESIKEFKNALVKARTVFWNGPLGLFEDAKFAEGTKQVGAFLADFPVPW